MIIRCFICLLLIISLSQVNGQIKEHEVYRAGFQTLTIIDFSRVYKPNAPINDHLHFRPLDLDIWYPSTDIGKSKLHFKDLFKLFEERANKYSDKTTFAGIQKN